MHTAGSEGQVGTSVRKLPPLASCTAPLTAHSRLRPALQVPPWPIFRAGTALASRFALLETGLQPPHARVLGVSFAAFQTKALYSVAKLGVADALAAGPLPVSVCQEASLRALASCALLAAGLARQSGAAHVKKSAVDAWRVLPARPCP